MGKEQETITDRVKKKATVKIETVGMSPKIRRSQQMLADSGGLLATEGYDHIGAAVVHFYKNKSNDNEMVFQTMAPMIGVNEVQASIGLDQLKKKLMAAFGRKV